MWPTCVLIFALISSVSCVCTPPNCNDNGDCDPATSVCICRPPWTGSGCESHDPCKIPEESGWIDRVCPENGKCVPSPGNPLQSECQCNDKFVGKTCVPDPCFLDRAGNPKPPPCQNNGNCETILNAKGLIQTARCRCRYNAGFPPEWIGMYCHQKNPCYHIKGQDPPPEPCFGRGECEWDYTRPPGVPHPGLVTKFCKCQYGWDNVTYCEYKDPCITNLGRNGFCKNAGSCFIDHSVTPPQPVCRCAPGYDGTNCERFDQCESPPCKEESSDKMKCNPCMNEGKCETSLVEVGSTNKPSSLYNDTHIRISNCDCTGTLFTGDYCDELKTQVVIIPSGHTGGHADNAEIIAGKTELFYIIFIAIGNGDVEIDSGDGFDFSLSTDALQPLPEDLPGLEKLKELAEKTENKILYYPLSYVYKKGMFNLAVKITEGDGTVTERKTKVTAKLPPGLRCVPSSKLMNVGHSLSNMPDYTRADLFVVEVDLRFSCFEDAWLDEILLTTPAPPPGEPIKEIPTKFRFQWKLYKLGPLFPSPNYHNDWHIENLVNSSVKYLKIPSYLLIPGTYWIECRALVTAPDKNEYGTSELGFFRINGHPPKIRLQGGFVRTVDASQEIVLDASLSKDGSYPEDSISLDFKWVCDCAKGPWKGPKVAIPAHTFDPGETIKITLTVSSLHSYSQTTATANIELHTIVGAELSMRCDRNCETFNPGDDILFVCEYSLEKARNYTWMWSPLNEVHPKPVEHDAGLVKLKLPFVSDVRRRSLQCSYEGSPGIMARFDFKINMPPIPGLSCQISPPTGEYLVTEFSIECNPFEDEQQPVEYSFFAEVPPAAYLGKLEDRVLLGHDTSPHLDEIYLPVGSFNIIVSATDKFGLSTELRIPVTLTMPTSNMRTAFKNLGLKPRSLSERRFLRGDYQGALQLQLAVASGLEDALSAGIITKNEADHVLARYEEMLLQVPQHSFKITEQLIHATHLIDHVENRADDKVLLEVTRSVHEASSKLVEYALNENEVTSSKELEILAEAVTDSGSRLLAAAKACEKWDQNADITSMLKCNERDLTEFDPQDQQNVEAYFDVIEDDLSVFDKEHIETLTKSASLKKETANCAKSARNAVRAMRGGLDAAVGGMHGVAFHHSTDHVSTEAEIVTELHADRKTTLETKDPSKHTDVHLKITESTLKEMQERVDEEGKLEIQTMITNDNAFIDDKSACPSTPTLHLRALDSETHVPILLENLKEPIEIVFPINKPISDAELDIGETTVENLKIPEVEDLDNYYQIPSYQAQLPYNSKIVVQIWKKSSPSMIFKVLPLPGRRPLLTDFCKNETITEVNPITDTFIFTTEEIPFDEEPEEPYIDYHIGVLAFDMHNVHRSQNFSVVITRHSCIYRDDSKDAWSEKGCKVGNLTGLDSSNKDLTKMVCLCNHASVIAGVRFIVPTSIDGLDPIDDLSFGDIQQNPIVLVTVCVLLGIYAITMIICFLFDIRDAKRDARNGVTVMTDLRTLQDKPGRQLYLVTVVTGCNFWAGTTSSIGLTIYGEKGRSKVITLKDRTRPVCLRGDIDTFLFEDKDLGQLDKIRMWTDHSGVDPGWYCRKVYVRQVSPNLHWHFNINKWLTVTAEEAKLIVEIPATSKEIRKKFCVRWKENFNEQIDNLNLWISIFRYSPASWFTRCQRLTCAFAVLSGYLLIDMLFHGIPTEDADGVFDFGDFEINLNSLTNGIQVVLLACPVGFILGFLFSHIKRRYVPTLIVWENGAQQRPVVIKIEDDGNLSDEFELLPPLESPGSSDSDFAIPSTDVDRMENWIGRRWAEPEAKDIYAYSGKHFVEPVDSGLGPTRSKLDRLGRHVLISSVRREEPEAFVFQGDYDVDQIEDLIEDEILKERKRHGSNKPQPKPWRKVTKKDIKDIDRFHDDELDKRLNPQRGSGYELCQITKDFRRFSKCELPWWFLFIAWLVAFGVIIMCLTFTVIFGLYYGYLRSCLWIETLVYSFLLSVFVVQPINALVITTMTTLLGRQQRVLERVQVVTVDARNIKRVEDSSQKPFNRNSEKELLKLDEDP